LRAQIVRRSPPFERLNPEIAAQSAHATVLFYWLGDVKSYLWVITPSRTALFTLPSSAAIEKLTQSYRKALLGPRDVADSSNADGTALYEMLVAPAKNLIPAGSRVIVVPDGSLNSLNFETLLVPGTKPHYWIEDVTVSYGSSLRMLAARRNSKQAVTGKLLLIGDPIVPDTKYARLSEAASEMDSVQSNFPAQGTRVYARDDATPLAYLNSGPEKYSYVHFVAHGTASQISPLDSAIVLSKATN